MTKAARTTRQLDDQWGINRPAMPVDSLGMPTKMWGMFCGGNCEIKKRIKTMV
jgi:hypothetical protein